MKMSHESGQGFSSVGQAVPRAWPLVHSAALQASMTTNVLRTLQRRVKGGLSGNRQDVLTARAVPDSKQQAMGCPRAVPAAAAYLQQRRTWVPGKDHLFHVLAAAVAVAADAAGAGAVLSLYCRLC